MTEFKGATITVLKFEFIEWNYNNGTSGTGIILFWHFVRKKKTKHNAYIIISISSIY